MSDLADQIRAALTASGTEQELLAETGFKAILPELHARLLRAELITAGYDPPPVPGTWWLDTKATYLPDGSRSVVRVVSVSKTVTGWQASIVRYTVRMQDENAAGPTRGVIYLDTLVADYLPLPANEVPS